MFSERLLHWFDIHKRTHLPWRQVVSPYRVWISEIMLQQTRVETVIPYFERFMERFPDIESLAQAPEEALLKCWEGLGYYSRARNLQKAAKAVMSDYDGAMPTNAAELIRLPGIGPYTSGAIASMAFGEQVVAADGNAYRIAARCLAESGFLEDRATKERLEQFLQERIPAERPGDFNQALMDLGSGICVPNGEPLCESCPLVELCAARRSGRMREYPKKKPKRARKIEEWTVFVVWRAGRLALARRPGKGVLSDMWSLPMLEGWHEPSELQEALEQIGLADGALHDLGIATHRFSHIDWKMHGYLIECAAPEQMPAHAPGDTVSAKETVGAYPEEAKSLMDAARWRWASPQELEQDLSIPAAFRPFLSEESAAL